MKSRHDSIPERLRKRRLARDSLRPPLPDDEDDEDYAFFLNKLCPEGLTQIIDLSKSPEDGYASPGRVPAGFDDDDDGIDAYDPEYYKFFSKLRRDGASFVLLVDGKSVKYEASEGYDVPGEGFRPGFEEIAPGGRGISLQKGTVSNEGNSRSVGCSERRRCGRPRKTASRRRGNEEVRPPLRKESRVEETPVKVFSRRPGEKGREMNVAAVGSFEKRRNLKSGLRSEGVDKDANPKRDSRCRVVEKISEPPDKDRRRVVDVECRSGPFRKMEECGRGSSRAQDVHCSKKQRPVSVDVECRSSDSRKRKECKRVSSRVHDVHSSKKQRLDSVDLECGDSGSRKRKECETGSYRARDVHSSKKQRSESEEWDDDYAVFLRYVRDDDGVAIFNSGNGKVRYVEDDVEESCSSSDLQILDEEDVFNNEVNYRFITSKPDMIDMDGSGCEENVHSEFRDKLLEELRAPYDVAEYEELLLKIKLKRRKEITRQLRGGHEKVYISKQSVESYLEQYPDLAKKISSSRGNRRKTLNILRGFFFYMSNLPMKGVFMPWKDQSCLLMLPPQAPAKKKVLNVKTEPSHYLPLPLHPPALVKKVSRVKVENF